MAISSRKVGSLGGMQWEYVNFRNTGFSPKTAFNATDALYVAEVRPIGDKGYFGIVPPNSSNPITEKTLTFINKGTYLTVTQAELVRVLRIPE